MLHYSRQGVTGGQQEYKKALYICVNDQSLNRNLGKYQLPHIWDEVLLNTPQLQLN